MQRFKIKDWEIKKFNLSPPYWAESHSSLIHVELFFKEGKMTFDCLFRTPAEDILRLLDLGIILRITESNNGHLMMVQYDLPQLQLADYHLFKVENLKLDVSEP